MEQKQALIIIDVQNDYFDGGANPLVGSLEASKNANRLLTFFRENNLSIIHIQHLSTRSDSAFFIPNTHGAEIHYNVKPLANEKVIIKHYPNSFRETELLEYLRTNKITDLVICGMMTHMCVDSSTRAAKDFGFDCTVIGDACATKDLQVNENTAETKDVQTAFLSALNYYYSIVLDTDEYIENMQEA